MSEKLNVLCKVKAIGDMKRGTTTGRKEEMNPQ